MLINEGSEETLNTEGQAEPDNNSADLQSTIPPTTVDDKDKKIAELEAANNALLDSLKNSRAKKAAEVLDSTLVEQPAKSDDSKVDDVDKKIAEYFKKEEATQKAKNKETAIKVFWNKFKEFNPENDITGVRNQSLLNALSRINMSNSSTVEEFYSDIVDAAKLRGLIKDEVKQGTSLLNKEASTTSVPSSQKSSVVNPLNSEQEKIRLERGWTVEQYLEKKSRHPKILP